MAENSTENAPRSLRELADAYFPILPRGSDASLQVNVDFLDVVAARHNSHDILERNRDPDAEQDSAAPPDTGHRDPAAEQHSEAPPDTETDAPEEGVESEDGLKIPYTKKQKTVVNARSLWSKPVGTKMSQRERGRERTAARKKAYTQSTVDVFIADQTLDARKLPMASTGWRGLNWKKLERGEMVKRWEAGTIIEDLRHFQRIPFETKNRGTSVVDVHGRQLVYRSNLSPKIESLLPQINAEAAIFVQSVKHPFTEGEMQGNARGSHFFSIAGHDREYREVPTLSQWHQKNKGSIDHMFREGSVWSIIQGVASSILRCHWGEVDARYRMCASFMLRKYGITPQFGQWFNFCLNATREGVPRVHCKPHVDFKNIALGICLVFVYGNFNHKEKSWLVIWEAGIILEIPPGVFVSYPSSIFFHFNFDIDQLEIVTTEDGEIPTKENSKPLNVDAEAWEKGYGRGSAVWFSQASMFMTSELGSTVSQAKQAGVKSTCDIDSWLEKGIFPHIHTN